MIGESGFVAKNVAECRVSVRAFEGSTAVEHFEDEDTESPPEIARRVNVATRKVRKVAQLTSRQLNCDPSR